MCSNSKKAVGTMYIYAIRDQRLYYYERNINRKQIFKETCNTLCNAKFTINREFNVRKWHWTWEKGVFSIVIIFPNGFSIVFCLVFSFGDR